MEALQTLSRNNRYPDTVLKIVEPANDNVPYDRPGWIPPEITHDWDPSPYAYQTEEEQMPGGGLHGRLLAYIMAILQDIVESRDMMLLMDTFMLYRDALGVKQRIAPDLLLMPFHAEPPSAYDLDIEPTPLLVGEITSPDSHAKDLENSVPLYASLNIPAYLAIDPITPKKRRRQRIRLYLWRNVNGLAQQITPDADGYFAMPEMQVKIKAQGQNLIFADIVTGELLKDSGQLRQWAETESVLRKQAEAHSEREKQRAEREKQRAEREKQRAEREKQRAEREKQRADQLAAKIRELGVSL